jgi:glycosyltransferase involved in cell wall biosynthesis
MKRKCSIVIPTYNSATSLFDLVKRLDKTLRPLFSDYEIIFVVDGSPDQSWQIIRSLATKNPKVRGFNLMRNYGQHNALFCGIMAAKYELIGTIDDDLQNPPEELSKMLVELEKGFDIVYGTPIQEQHGLLRDLASVTTKMILSSIMGAEQAKSVGAFRLFRKEVRQAFRDFHGPYINIDVLLSWGSTNIGSVPVKHNPREKGKSTYTITKLFTHAINLITGFSTLPLRISSIMGFLFSFVGIVILIYVLIRRIFFSVAVPGFTFLASTISFFSGAMLFALGIIGEYLARMYFRVMDKPKFVVRETVNQPAFEEKYS